jgi:anaerobic magnesium-protoporphyrin IX monomethyl ester cyclase
MKILIVTIPLRDESAYGIPYGALAIINYVKERGFDDIDLYHIDANRPRYEDVLAHIVETKPDVLGISAIVSTSYEYTKQLSIDIKNFLPETTIVIGGNMAASAEILLRKTGVDICVIGEGEKSFLNVLRRLQESNNPMNYPDIKGLALLDNDDRFINTGYETALPAEEIWNIDLKDLESAGDINKVFHKAFNEDTAVAQWISNDPRSYEPHRRDKTVGYIACAKGCVARCTFCHRWDKGIRHIPVDNIMQELDQYIEDYNVGFIQIFAETFGNDERWLRLFCKEIKKRDVLWRSGGIRANAIAATPEWIKIMGDAGCIGLTYGNETGSEKMLQIMEKKVSIKDNYNAMQWTIEAGIYTGIQLVLGMPGETSETIGETIEYCKFVTTLSAEKDPNYLSCNYAQALPGTPLYEYGRHKGLIGQDIDSEEAYLLLISDRNARDESTTLNFTEESTLTCRTWRPRITIEVNYNFVKTFGGKKYRHVLSSSKNFKDLLVQFPLYNTRVDHTGNYDIPPLFTLIRRRYFGLAMICHPIFFNYIIGLLPVMVLINTMRNEGLGKASKLLLEHLMHKLGIKTKSAIFSHEYKSLRKIVSKDLGDLPIDSIGMKPYREGR